MKIQILNRTSGSMIAEISASDEFFRTESAAAWVHDAIKMILRDAILSCEEGTTDTTISVLVYKG